MSSLGGCIGDTVRLCVEFKNWNNIYADPTNITLTITDTHHRQLGDSYDVTAQYRTDIGKYYYPYMIPHVNDNFVYYEFSGMLENEIITVRDRLPIKWVI